MAGAELTNRYVLMAGTPYETPYYVKTGETQLGPKVFIIGGCHGNEPAGYLAARELANWSITNGTLIVLPEAHKEAIRRNVRGYPENMNALFPGNPNGRDMERLAYEIWHAIDYHRPGLLVTLHESVGYHKRSATSYGYTLCHDFAILNPLMELCLDRVNGDLPDDLRRFEVFVEPHPTCPTYCAWSKLKIPATSIETSMEDELPARVRHQLMMCMGFLDEAGVGYEPHSVPRLTTAPRERRTDVEVWSPYLAVVEAGRTPPRGYAALHVRSDLLGAKVYVDGFYKGCTPAPMMIETNAASRAVRVSVQPEGWPPFETSVTLEVGMSKIVDALFGTQGLAGAQ